MFLLQQEIDVFIGDITSNLNFDVIVIVLSINNQ